MKIANQLILLSLPFVITGCVAPKTNVHIDGLNYIDNETAQVRARGHASIRNDSVDAYVEQVQGVNVESVSLFNTNKTFALPANKQLMVTSSCKMTFRGVDTPPKYKRFSTTLSAGKCYILDGHKTLTTTGTVTEMDEYGNVLDIKYSSLTKQTVTPFCQTLHFRQVPCDNIN
ncbi:hypothetical protein QFW85_04380 [Vibrio chagasii]|uniref:hypothetical protein n=1 Tax=Vibrio chagasii TaxID=170679 RepID=UPI003DA95185